MPIDGDYFLVCMATYVVLKRSDGKIYLMRRKNTGWYSGFYNMPAGRVERHETMLDCAMREVREEAGVDIAPDDLKLFLVSNRFTGGEDAQPDWIDFFYMAENWQGEPYIAEPHKCDAAGWYDINDTSIEIVPNIRDALKYLVHDKLCYGLHSPQHDYSNQKVACPCP